MSEKHVDGRVLYSAIIVIAGGAWLTPTLILPARFAKISAQLYF
jgi:hypothetical protein